MWHQVGRVSVISGRSEQLHTSFDREQCLDISYDSDHQMAVTSIQWDSNSTLMTLDTVMGSRMESGTHPAGEALITEITSGLFFLQLLSKMHGCSKRSGRFGFGRTSFRDNVRNGACTE